MKSLLLAAGALAVVAVGAPAARAADLDYGRPDRYSSPYDDPRYRELYGEPPRYTERYEYQERSNTYPAPTPYAYRDGPPRYTEDYRYGHDCLPRHEVRRRLRLEGWSDFHDVELRANTALLRARRLNGDLYDLKVDRCTGSVISALPLERYVPGPYAYGPRRWSRPYF
jgi:hypothetical protein